MAEGLELDEEETSELLEKLKEAKERMKGLEDDYDVLFRFLIAFCALPKGATIPDIGITPTEAYIHSMVRGTKDLKPRLEKFIEFARQFLPQSKETPNESPAGP